MGSEQFRFYSTAPRPLFDHVGQTWPGAVVRRHGWKVGGSDIWYVTIALDEKQAAAEFAKWLEGHSRRADLRGYVGSLFGGTYRRVVLHDPIGRTNTFLDVWSLATGRLGVVVKHWLRRLRRASKLTPQ
jgi:hypothetical protein